MDAAPISLYLDLEEGQKADLEVVARAALAFSAAINELSFAIDPNLTVRIELASGSEGSLSLNAIIRTIARHLAPLAPTSPLTLQAIVLTILAWFAADIRTAVVVDEFHRALGVTEGHELSEAEKQQIADIVNKALEGHVAENHVHGVYRALESDPAIKGVGTTTTPGTRPAVVVPRAEFPARSGLSAPTEIPITKRERRERTTLTLISPVLLASTTRKWRFSSAGGQISAQMKDVHFLSRLLSGQERVPMKANIEMDVLLETSEEMREGVWTITGRSILQVTHVHPAPVSQDLFSMPSQEDNTDD
jgi:hypothetical protein